MSDPLSIGLHADLEHERVRNAGLERELGICKEELENQKETVQHLLEDLRLLRVRANLLEEQVHDGQFEG